MTKENVLIFNHKEKQCGIYQYGHRVASILQNSTKYNFIYCEADSAQEYHDMVNAYNPIGIIYNYYPMTMPWLSQHLISRYPNIVHYGLFHEEYIHHLGLNYHLYVDSTHNDTGNTIAVPRPLFKNKNVVYPEITVPTISSFGFGFGNKGFVRAINLVNSQFDEAIIRLHMPNAFFGDADKHQLSAVLSSCHSVPRKAGIQLHISTDFLSDDQVLDFLASSTINVFLYDEMMGRGLSSVIDYALSVNVPIAITKTYMFRHIRDAQPSICIEDRPLRDIISSGNTPLQQYREKWSHENFIKKYEYIISSTRR